MTSDDGDPDQSPSFPDLSEEFRYRVMALGKGFSEMAHAQAFLDGHLLLRTLRHFRQVEGDVRRDAHDGDAGLYDPKQVKIFVGDHEVQDVLAVQITSHAAMSAHVLCTVAFDDRALPREIGEHNRSECEGKLRLGSQFKFGPYFVFVKDAVEFIRRMESAMDKTARRWQHTVVRYAPADFSGQFGGLEGFIKREAFRDEREYRFLLEGPDTPEPLPSSELVLEIGSIRDIALATTVEQFDRDFRFYLDAPGDALR